MKYLVFQSNSKIANELRKQLEPTHKVFAAEAGSSFEVVPDGFILSPNEPQHFAKIADILTKEQTKQLRVLFAWRPNWSEPTPESIEEELAHGFYAVFHLTQALIKTKSLKNLQLLFCYPGGAQLPNPASDALAGFIHTVALEKPPFKYRCIALMTEDIINPTRIVELALREFEEEGDDIEVRYQGNQRQVRRLKNMDQNPESNTQKLSQLTPNHAFQPKEKGVYLITGGMGGLGYIFGHHLAEQFKARLLLCGRGSLNDPKQTLLQKISDVGGQAHYQSADITQWEHVKSLVDTCMEKWGSLDGVIHAAGVLRDAFILKKDFEDVRTVLAPKVHGTLLLDRATAHVELDFLVLFSSAAAITGNMGQCDYSYANAFMDQFARFRESLRLKGQRHGKTLSINWPLWADGGMTVDANSQKLMEKTFGMVPMHTQAGIDALDHGLNSQLDNLFVIEGFSKQLSKFLGLSSLVFLWRG